MPHTNGSLNSPLRQRIRTELWKGKSSEDPIWNTIKHMLARYIFYEAERKDLIEKLVQFRKAETVLNTRSTDTDSDVRHPRCVSTIVRNLVY